MAQKTPVGGEEVLQTPPEATYVFEDGDVMLVMGPNEALRSVRVGTPRSEK